MVSDHDSYCARNDETKPDSQFFVWYYPDASRFAKIHRGEAETAYDWAAAPVAGQPALRASSSDRCYLVVALTDTQTLEIRIEDDKVSPCDRATQVAEAVVRKLGG